MIKRLLFTGLALMALTLYGQKTDWILSFGGVSDDQAFDCAQAPDGTLLVCGVASDTTDFGDIHMESLGTDMFVMKLDTTGKVLWQTTATSLHGSNITAYGVAADAAGNVFIGGKFVDTAYFGAYTLYPYLDEKGDVFVAKLNSDGEILWAKSFVGPGGDQVEKVCTSGTDVVVTIRASNILNIGTNAVQDDYPDATTTSMFSVILALDENGAYKWATKVNAKSAFPRDIKSGSDGSIYVVSEASMVSATPFVSQVGVVGLTPLGNPLGNTDLYLMKISPENGSVTWVNRIGSTGTDMSYALALDKEDNIYLSGLVQGEVQLNSMDGNYIKVPLAGAKFDYLICKYDSDGNLFWGQIEGGSDTEGIYDVAVADKGELYLLGYYLDPGTIIGDDQYTLDRDGSASLIIRHDPDGNYLWSRDAYSHYNDGATSNFYGWGMCMGSNYQLLMCGSYIGSGTFFTGETVDDGMLNKNVWIALFEPGDIDTITVIEGIGQVETGLNLCYPNPASDILYLSMTGIEEVCVTDLSGRRLLFIRPDDQKIAVGMLENGLYLVSGRDKEGRIFSQKIQINR